MEALLQSEADVNKRHGDWMQTYTGRQFWPLDPRFDEIDIVDIAHALSMICRFGGHCERFYSVAEHSVHVSRVCDPADALAGLLHDASEAYVADIIRPIKPYLKRYRHIEDLVSGAIWQRFGLPMLLPKSVKRADEAVLAAEAEQILKPHPAPWGLTQEPADIYIECWSPTVAKAVFLARFQGLGGGK